MRGGRRIAFALVVAAQALVLLALIGLNERALATGDRVTLETAPVDPVDLFRGNYATLRYDIGTVTVAAGTQPGDRVYVPLRRTGDHWSGGFGYPSPPSDGEFIRGSVRSVFERTAQVEYGIETYYADEGEAQALQYARGLLVTVALDGDGQAHITRVERVR
jgi:uncharacterized membrane-anchored protein